MVMVFTLKVLFTEFVSVCLFVFDCFMVMVFTLKVLFTEFASVCFLSLIASRLWFLL